MENNKFYLKNIHWVFFLGLVQALILIFLPNWLRLVTDSEKATRIILTVVYTTFPLTALGIVTDRWRGVAIAAISAVTINIGSILLTYGQTDYTWLRYVLFFIAFNIPL